MQIQLMTLFMDGSAPGDRCAGFADITLTSVLKNLDVAVFYASRQVVEGTFVGGRFVGTLENNAVGLAPFHALDTMVHNALKTELEKVREAIIRGEIQTLPYDAR